MSVTTSSPAFLAAGLRRLTTDEAARLDWLRGQLAASRADVRSADGLGALVDSSRAAWARSERADVPEGMLAALAVGLGDLLLAEAPGAAWVLRTADGTSGPAVVDATGEAVVLPFEDVRSRWDAGRTDWVAGYVAAATEHLRGEATDVPRPRTSPEPAVEVAVALPVAPPVEVQPQAAEPAPFAPAPIRPATLQPAAPVAAPPSGPADLPFPPSAQVQDLVLRALEDALEAAAVGGADLPFAIAPTGSGWHVEAAADGGLDAVRAWAAACGAPRAAVAWLGELDGEAAVFAEASDAGAPGLVVAHRFATRSTPEPARRHARPRVADPVGGLVLVGQSEPLLPR